MTNQATTYLKYANVQMAAEALFGIGPTDFPGTPRGSDSMSVDSLKLGNRRTSQFTPTQATEFSDDWTVVEHI